jgi:hypothetical protein
VALKPRQDPARRTSQREWPRLLALPALLVVAFSLRVYGITWDHGYLFHPDERQIVFVTARLGAPWPPDWHLLLSPDSPLNPGFFSYGSLPMYLLRALASVAAQVDPAMASPRVFYVIGRLLSALADTGTLWITWALGKKLFGLRAAWLAASLLALAVLHIQLAHYYAVDTLLTLGVMLVLWLLVRLVEKPSLGRLVGVALVTGLASAVKLSALALLAPVCMAWIVSCWLPRPEKGNALPPDHRLAVAIRGLVIAGWVTALTFVALQPYTLIDWPTFWRDALTESMMVRGRIDMPYTRQFAYTRPYLYQLQQLVKWSLGPALGAVGVLGAIWQLVRIARPWKAGNLQALAESIGMAWLLIYFGIVGSFYAKFLRYMLPVTPLLCLWGGAMLARASLHKSSWVRVLARAGTVVTLLSTALYAVAFVQIYGSPHPWEQSTEWICNTLPPDSVLMIEHWDQPLPMLQGAGAHDCWEQFEIVTFPAYDPDTAEKRDALVAALQRTEYIVLASNRLYGSILPLSERYPLTSTYYRRLFAEELGFELVHVDQVYPHLGPVRLVNDTLGEVNLPRPALLQQEGYRPHDLLWQDADESYSVYDHPMPLVFRRTRSLDAQTLTRLLTEAP